MCLVVKRGELRPGGRCQTTELDERAEPHLRHNDLSFRTAPHDTDRIIAVAVDDMTALRGDRQKPQHVAAGDGGDKCLLGIDCRGNRERSGHRMRRRGGGDFYATVKKPAVAATVTIIRENGALPIPRNRRGVIAQPPVLAR